MLRLTRVPSGVVGALLIVTVLITSAVGGAATPIDPVVPSHGDSTVGFDGSVLSAVEVQGYVEIALRGTTDASVAGHYTVEVDGADLTDVVSILGSGDGTGGVVTLMPDTGGDAHQLNEIVVQLDTPGLGPIPVTATGAHLGPAVADSDPIVKGTLVAYATNGHDVAFDLMADGQVIRSASTGPNSSVYVLDTADLDVGRTYWINETDSMERTAFELVDLGLSVAAESTTVFQNERLRAEVSIRPDAPEGLSQRESRWQLVDENGVVVDEMVDNFLGEPGDIFYENATRPPGVYTVRIIDVYSGTTAETAPITVSDVTPEALFTRSVYSDERGDVVEFTVALRGTRTAYVRLGSNEAGFNTSFFVEDGDEDGEVGVAFNTWKTTDRAEVFLSELDEDDAIYGDTNDLVELAVPIEPGVYDLGVATGGRVTDVSSVVVGEPSVDELVVNIGAATATVETRAEFDEWLVERLWMSVGDYLIIEVHASGLEGSFPDQLAAKRLDGTMDGVLLRLTEINPGTGETPTVILGNDPFLIILDDTVNDTFYAVLEVGAVFETGDVVEAEFIIDETNPLYTGPQRVHSFVNVSIDFVRFYEDPVIVEADAGQTIRGWTSRAPGTTIELVVVAQNDAFPDKPATTTVQPDGTWSATFDFSGDPPGTEFVVEVTSPVPGSAIGRIEGSAGPAPTPTEPETPAPTQSP
ncbi:MAG: hypothetical protein R3324_06140, partial [Halobacteriales archaeon]|nr:hypothetical protein [Halobacteriales archaeon]